MKRLKLLLVDFDGVTSNGRFYRSSIESEKHLGKAAADYIFAPRNSELVRKWMRGELTYDQVHDIVENEVGIDARLLDNILERSIEYMPINRPLLNLVETLRTNGVTVGLFTDNMDVFDKISTAHHMLNKRFDAIYSSSKYGQLKLENETLLHTAIEEAGAELESTALVDDSPRSYNRARQYGLATYLYGDYEQSQKEFEAWLKQNYNW
ncbi:MAG TPA: HAD family hydrolase [Candidatus Saccharimonadales bacterium]|nr:HAD family hydrolase [Candidatus Saccharimonadales bacterium]